MLIVGIIGFCVAIGFHIVTKEQYPLMSLLVCVFVGIIGGGILLLIQ